MNRNKDKYRKFLEEYIPKSYLLKTNKTENIYLRVIENILVTEIFRENINIQKIECYEEFLEEYKNQFTKCLLYIGMNDYSGLEYSIRGTIENLLKFIYSLYIVEKYESITILSFRHLKEDLIEFQKNGLEMNISLIIKLCDVYGKFSNAIHGKNKDKTSLQYIIDIIVNEDKRMEDIDNVLLNILNIYEEILSGILQLEGLSTSEMLTLKRNLSNNRYNKLKNKLIVGS